MFVPDDKQWPEGDQETLIGDSEKCQRNVEITTEYFCLMSRNIAAHGKDEKSKKNKTQANESMDLTKIFRENIESIDWFIYLLIKGTETQLKTYFIVKKNLKKTISNQGIQILETKVFLRLCCSKQDMKRKVRNNPQRKSNPRYGQQDMRLHQGVS